MSIVGPEVVVRDLALRAGHQRGDRLAHRGLAVRPRRLGGPRGRGRRRGRRRPPRSTSALVIAPSGPVPATAARSTPSCRRPARERRDARPARGRRAARRAPAAPRRAAGGRGGAGARRGGRRRRARRAAVAAHGRERRADRHPLALADEQLARSRRPRRSRLDLGLARCRRRRRCRRVDGVAGLDAPLEQRARLHVGAERGHAELSHRPTSRRAPPRRSCPGCGSAASSRCCGVGDRHLGAADPRDRRVELVERLLGDARADLGGEAARCASPRRRPPRGACVRPRRATRRVVERAQHAQVDHLGVDARRAASSSAAASALRSVPP